MSKKNNKHGFKPLVLTITRAEIESLDIGPALAVINKAMKRAKSNTGRLSLSVKGYAKGERIQPENRKVISNYFRRLNEHFDGWFHLCNRWDNTLRMLFLMIAPLKEVGGQLCFDLSELRHFIAKHNCALEKLHRDLGIPSSTTTHAQKLMTAYFDNFFLNLKKEPA